MRPFILLILGFLVLAVIFTVILFVPEHSERKVEISKLDLNRQPQPLIPSDPGAGYILEFFPDPKDAIQDATITQSMRDAAPPHENVAVEPAVLTEDPAELQREIDKNRMLSLIHDWVYTGYLEVGRAKEGTIRKQRENVSFTIYEGTVLENGIKIAALTEASALLELGAYSFYLERAVQPGFYEDVKQTMRPLTRAEQEEAFEYYMKVYGNKFKEMSKGYKPPYGVQNPQQVTVEQQKQGLQEYWKRYGEQFAKDNAYQQPSFYYSDNAHEKRDAYNKYWQQFGNGQPQPNFDEVFSDSQTGGPGSRIVPLEQLQQQ